MGTYRNVPASSAPTETETAVMGAAAMILCFANASEEPLYGNYNLGSSLAEFGSMTGVRA